MKKLFFASIMMLLFVFTINVHAQESEDYAMWETIMMTPDYTKLKTLETNMRKHNQTYHKEGIHTANVYNIATGPNAGKIVWIMGPTMLKHFDTRPGDSAHDDDWRDNVMPYIKEIHTVECWSGDSELSNTEMMGNDPSKYPLLFIRYFELNIDHMYTSNDLFKKVSATIKSLEGEHPWGLYYNMFLQGDLGRHIAAIRFYKTWAEMDQEVKFKEAFEKLHGENSFEVFLDTQDDTYDNRWDEIWHFNKAMSGK